MEHAGVLRTNVAGYGKETTGNVGITKASVHDGEEGRGEGTRRAKIKTDEERDE